MRKLRIGVIGVGNMGRGIVNSFIRAKQPLAIWDISRTATEGFKKTENVKIVEPKLMAGMCSVIFFVVPSSPQIAESIKGRNGILAYARQGLVIYDLTTSNPVDTKKLAGIANKKSIAYLDAGMSGGAAGAEAGTLTLMIGGDEQAFKRTRKFLKPITGKLFYLGDSGAGHTMKLIHNMVCHTIFLATCEGGRLAERVGIRLSDAIDIFNAANARSYASEVRFPHHIISEKWDAKSRIFNLHKDVGMAVALAGSLQSEAALGQATYDFLERAVSLGMTEQDYSLLYRDYEKIQKTRSKPKRSPKLKTSKR